MVKERRARGQEGLPQLVQRQQKREDLDVLETICFPTAAPAGLFLIFPGEAMTLLPVF